MSVYIDRWEAPARTFHLMLRDAVTSAAVKLAHTTAREWLRLAKKIEAETLRYFEKCETETWKKLEERLRNQKLCMTQDPALLDMVSACCESCIQKKLERHTKERRARPRTGGSRHGFIWRREI